MNLGDQPAFPLPNSVNENHEGMSTRTLLAGMIMGGLCADLARIRDGNEQPTPEAMSVFAVRMTSALLAELEKQPKSE